MVLTSGKRIAVNVAATYGRSLVALALGLFASRWVLEALGVDDFGLCAVVGSLMMFGSFLGGVLQVSVTRHFAFALGKGGEAELKGWFLAALAVYVALAVLLALILLPVGSWAIRNLLNIPPGRMNACLGLFYLSIASTCVTSIGIPFAAFFTAHQRFGVLAILGSLSSLYVFCCAFGLRTYGGDRLVAYAVYINVGIIVAQLVQAAWAGRGLRRMFACAPVSLTAGELRRRMGKLLSFAGWNVFGGGGYLISVHGAAFVTNRFFGAAGNAAYGVAQQVQTHTEALANALVTAFEPAVVSRKGAADDAGARRLAGQVDFFGALLLMFFAVPFALEMETVLKLWLVRPPDWAGAVCAVMLAGAALNKLTMGRQLAIQADGRIAAWQVAGCLIQIAALPLSVAFAIRGGGVMSAAIAYATIHLGCLLSNLYFGGKVAGLSIRDWTVESALPFFGIVLLAIAVGGCSRLWMDAGFVRVMVTSVLTSVVFAAGIGMKFRMRIGV